MNFAQKYKKAWWISFSWQAQIVFLLRSMILGSQRSPGLCWLQQFIVLNRSRFLQILKPG